MVMINILIPCTACGANGDEDSQPNYCQTCGGSRWLKSTITQHQFRSLNDIPRVSSAYVVDDKPVPRRRVHKPRRARKGAA